MPTQSGQSLERDLSNLSPDGTRLGQTTSDLISFYGATPIAQQASTVPMPTQLINLGLLPSGTHGNSLLNVQTFGQTANEPSTTGGDYVMPQGPFPLPQ